MNDLTLFGIPVLSFITAGAGAYFGAYLRKKGENLATKEDFEELKTQTEKLREATKEIDTKIEKRVWNDQRRWELRRDTLLVIMTSLRRAHRAVNALYSAYGADMKIKDAQSKERILEQSKYWGTPGTPLKGSGSLVIHSTTPFFVLQLAT